MSLINEALKKAERERASGELEGTQPHQGGARPRVAKRRPPMQTQKILVIVAGALLLTVLSAVLTGVFVSHKVEQAHPPAKAAAAPPSIAAPPPVIVAHIPPPPVAPPPPTDGASSPKTAVRQPGPQPLSAQAADPSMTLSGAAAYAPSAASSSSAAVVVRIPLPSAEAAPSAASSPAPAAPVSPPAEHRHDPRIQALVEGFHVTGIRSAGSGSKVLMNDRVFRVNDVVDYGYGLKLVKVSPDMLTFVDAGGETYVKNF